jgi:serine/threonine protein kinase
LLSGSLPFPSTSTNDNADNQTEDLQSLLVANKKAEFFFDPSDGWEKISESAKDFISKLLVANGEDRMSLEDAKKHDWLKSLYD